MRRVGEESSKTYEDKLNSGFFQKYMSGTGLDIGYKGYLQDVVPILDTAIGIEKDDLIDDKLPFPNESQDYVYSSHALEHIDDYKQTLQDWYRVLKTNGYLVITVPHQFLYEKIKPRKTNNGRPGSKWNGDHRRFITPASLLKEIEESLEPNSYRIRLLEDGDKGYNYSIGPDKHCAGQCEILVVVQKIEKPSWNIE